MESKEKIYDYKESVLIPEEQEELNRLRRLQIEKSFTDEERKRFLELAKKEEELHKEKPKLTDEEKLELQELRKKQIESKEWTKEDAKRLIELQ